MENVGKHISFEKVLTPQERAVGWSWHLEPGQRIRNVGLLPIYTEDQDAVGKCRTQLKLQLPKAGFPYLIEVTTTLPLIVHPTPDPPPPQCLWSWYSLDTDLGGAAHYLCDAGELNPGFLIYKIRMITSTSQAYDKA